MLDAILDKDIQLLIFLNSLGNEHWDSFWLAITHQFNWTPLFVFIIYLVIKTFGWKRGGFIVLSMIVLVAFSDQFTNLIKNYFQRLRPNNNPSVQKLLRSFFSPQSYSFISGHATTSTFFSVFTILILRNTYRYIYFILLFPLFFAYSRVYLGVHFPLDILVGMTTGAMLGCGYHFFYKKIEKKLFV